MSPSNVSSFLFKAGSYSTDDLLVPKFEGREGISELYNFTVHVATKKIQIEFKEVIGKPATLTIMGDSAKERYVNGIIRECEFIKETKAHLHYRFELVPSFWLLSNRVNSRIFQNMTTPDIIKDIFDEAGLTSEYYDFSLQRDYEIREYCVQYQESDLDFVFRLMEEEGIFFYFRHEENSHVMVIAGHSIIHQDIETPSTIVYKELTGQVAGENIVYSHRHNEKIRSGAVLLRDFNFTKPTLDLECSSDYKKDTKLKVYEHPGLYSAKEDGNSLAEIHLEELQVQREVNYGESTCIHFIPGSKFTLKEHPNGKYNIENLLVRVTHKGSHPQVLGEEAPDTAEILYKNEFQTIPGDVSFRPARKNKKNLISGNQTAVVVGPAGEEIYTDEHGRIKVQFHWDRDGEKDEHSSCWIRVAQLWAGTGWGGLYIPRIGQEVVVSFLNGDPDRPMVVGCVYNGDNDPPYTLPDDKTKSTVKSNTSLGGGGYNELVMEDQSGKTQVVLYNAYGHKITQDEATQALTIETRDKNTVRLDDKDRNISIFTTENNSLIMDDENEIITLKTTDGHSIEFDDKNGKILARTTDGHVLLFDDKNKKIELTTIDGHTAILDDQNKKIGITSANGHYLTIDDGEESITLEDSGGTHKFKIDIGGEKLIISTDSGAVDILAPSGKISLEATEIALEASGDIKISGANISSEAQMENKQKGLNVTSEADVAHKTKGGVSADLEGGAKTTIKGGIVMIN